MRGLLKLLMLCSFTWIQAHTIWLETETLARINEKHEIKIFFGEFDEEPTPTARCFSNLRDLELKIISPMGKEFIIKEKLQNDKYCSSFFVPMENGTYRVIVKHLVADIHRKKKITYQSIAFFTTNSQKESIRIGTFPLEFQFENQHPKVGEQIEVTFWKFGEKRAKEKLKIISDNGWEKTLSVDANGTVVFQPLWKGKYILEVVNTQEISGLHNGKPYEMDYEMLTYVIDVH